MTERAKTGATLPALTAQERDTILAALRAWQATPRARLAFHALATNGGETPPLTEAEIDRLCRRLERATAHGS